MRNLRMLKFPLFDLNEPVFGDSVRMFTYPPTGIAHVDVQHGVATLWTMCDMDAPQVWRTFHIEGTGQPLWFEPCYLGTLMHGPFVWHIFESFPEVKA